MIRLKREHLDEIIEHARREEVCGILAGRDGVVSRVYHGTNVAASPTVRYEMEPTQQLEIMRELEDEGQQMVAIYHSHPHSQAYPSRTDRDLAYYPDCVYIIVSLARPDEPVARAYRLRDKRIEEEEVAVDG